MNTDFDWEELKRRVVQPLDKPLEQKQLEEIFKARAAALARRAEDSEKTAGQEHLVFDLGTVNFAVRLTQLSSIHTLKWVTNIPGAPAFKRRVSHINGRVVSLLDLTELLGLEASGVKVREDRCLLLQHAGVTLGLLANEIHGVKPIDEGSLTPPSQETSKFEFFKGITQDMTLVIDGNLAVTSLRPAMETTN